MDGRLVRHCIIESLNRERSNKHINEYKKTDKIKFLNYIDIVPNHDIYDSIISHQDKKPHIYNSEKYNIFCLDNETKLINCFLEKIFS